MADYDEGARRIGRYVPKDRIEQQAVRDAVDDATANTGDMSTDGRNRALREFTDRIMDQELRGDAGQIVGKRKNLKVWNDRWGNLMAYNENTGSFQKLMDKNER